MRKLKRRIYLRLSRSPQCNFVFLTKFCINIAFNFLFGVTIVSWEFISVFRRDWLPLGRTNNLRSRPDFDASVPSFSLWSFSISQLPTVHVHFAAHQNFPLVLFPVSFRFHNRSKTFFKKLRGKESTLCISRHSKIENPKGKNLCIFLVLALLLEFSE